MRKIELYLLIILFIGCSKKSPDNSITNPPQNFSLTSWTLNGRNSQSLIYDISKNIILNLIFSSSIDRNSVAGIITLKDNSGNAVNVNIAYSNSDSNLIITNSAPLQNLARYKVFINPNLKSKNGGNLNQETDISFVTSIDSSDKFTIISDSALLDLVQRQTFKYFWDFGHPVSGLARERNTSGETVTSGGSGFGIMAIVAGINRNFISRTDGLARMQKIVSFIKNTAQKFHGAFPHWLNGSTGSVIPFSAKDDGADLVETSYLMQGLLTARQFFNGGDSSETNLRADINALWNGVEWNWFRKNNEEVLYWHWSPNYNWDMNFPIHGWNEALITYIMAASSPGYSIPESVYDNGWALNGGIKNGKTFYGIQLPLGPDLGGPLFFSHYSFLGVNPISLTDAYADYGQQTKAHALINHDYCKANPNNFYGYSDSSWGLTASDDVNGYSAHSPTNDDGVISPTAALSSFPYDPADAMKALRFFYYKLGDKIWKDYGFVDAFSLKDLWFASSFLAIDQGPIIIMIENYRSGLLWNLFMSAPEIKTGMHSLGFSSPNL